MHHGRNSAASIDEFYCPAIFHFRMKSDLDSLPPYFSPFERTIAKEKNQNSPSPSTSMVILVLFSVSTAFLPSPSLPEPSEDDEFKELIWRSNYNTIPEERKSVISLAQYFLPILLEWFLVGCLVHLSRFWIHAILIVNSVIRQMILHNLFEGNDGKLSSLVVIPRQTVQETQGFIPTIV